MGKILSIDIGQLFLKVAYLETTETGLKLLNYDLKISSPSERNDLAITGFITNFVKSNSISAPQVFLTISDDVFVKQLSLPVLSKKEIVEALKWQVKEELAFEFAQATYEWHVVKEFTDTDGAKKQEVIFIAASDKIVEKYILLFRKCGLTLSGISSAFLNYANILKLSNITTPAQVILDIGHKDSSLAYYEDKQLKFTRRLAFSSEKLIHSLTGTLISDKAGRLQLSYEEARDLKDVYGIPEDEDMILKDNIKAVHVISMMRPLLEGLSRELKYSLDYFISTFKIENISSLYLSGEGSDIKNLASFLEKELKVSISKLPFPDSLDLGGIEKDKLERDRSLIISPLGAALSAKEGAAFVPVQLKMQKIELVEKVSLRLIVITVALSFLLALSFVRYQIRIYNQKIDIARKYLISMSEVSSLAMKVAPYDYARLSIQKGKVPVDDLLKTLSALSPGEVKFDELALDQENHSLVLKGMINARKAHSQRSLEGFINKLKSSAFFESVQTVSFRQDDLSSEFELKCELTH
ncbi:MAG: pilus assembly protein PilM [Candidatus Omnitrophica bacterium]|nr:pilus assembly protein PilM [Candidatus Omnitrophota bacterium]MBU1869232.1 pilus assembly protein PilM [Candidatus Omnitrophota bacterium]